MSHSVKAQGQAVGPLFPINACLWSHQTPSRKKEGEKE